MEHASQNEKKQKGKRIKLRKPSARLKAELKSNKHQQWRRKRFKHQDGLCYYCAIKMTEKNPNPKAGERRSDVTLDHFLPIHLSGEDHWENVVACCKECNTKKGHLHPKEFPAHPIFQLDYDKRLWGYLHDDTDDDDEVSSDDVVEIYHIEDDDQETIEGFS